MDLNFGRTYLKNLKHTSMETLVFIPSFNDQLSLDPLVNEIISNYKRTCVLIIDDGSKKMLKIKCRSKRVIVFRLPINVGLGVTTSIALGVAMKNNFKYFLRLDADGQHPVKYIKTLKERIVSSKTNICIGARSNHERFNSFRGVISALLKRHLRYVANWLSSASLKDWNTGFFGLDRIGIVKMSQFSYSRYPEVEFYLRAHNIGLKVSTMSIYQKERDTGKSSIDLLQSIMLLSRSYLIFLRFLLEKKS